MWAAFLFYGAIVSAKPVLPRDGIDTCTTSSTSSQWLHTCDTTLFWPTSTNYYYGPTAGPSASAVLCNAEWVEYDGRASGLSSLGATSTSTIYEPYPTSTGACNTKVWGEGWHDTHTGPVTTLCDTIPRALGPRETLTSFWPGTGPCSTFQMTESTTKPVYRSPDPAPSCSLNTRDCIAIWSTYSSLSSAYRSAVPTPPPGDTNSPIRPTSCPSTRRNYTENDPCTNCHYLPGEATLFYWPVSTVSGDLCSQTGTTIPATPTGTGPNTAVINGNTFVSPTIYVSFTSIYARSNMRAHPGGSCGGEHENVIISVEPDAVSSYRGHRNAKYPIIGTAFPFSYDEFQLHQVGNYSMPLIPWDKYEGGGQCPVGTSCTLVRDDYRPHMGIPKGVMTQIDERWTACHRSWYIPPVSMVPLIGEGSWSGKAVPTGSATGNEDVGVAAVPESVGAAPTPKETGADW
ncbi:hypothetical protein P168DRAFT_304585 [Aspergillus campestris IBT 28561]|uniref:Uncharacterized protein n=1 Tax=Aspergillus campestris (strain IBT 28561) TaxID=1392248 RepID=A0A2I1D325_ASPC2|nr:uncharacterized protein P168DRAFT_304585 [Aspergillus campestris IBT 28561]PKY04280.1 hypothetical protein P168DRAFT_304585 [Aspergillus campestris IBT 28561]